MIKDEFGHERRLWCALVNQTTRDVNWEEFYLKKDQLDLTFKQQLKAHDNNIFKAYVFAGNGELASSFTKEFIVK